MKTAREHITVCSIQTCTMPANGFPSFGSSLFVVLFNLPPSPNLLGFFIFCKSEDNQTLLPLCKASTTQGGVGSSLTRAFNLSAEANHLVSFYSHVLHCRALLTQPPSASGVVSICGRESSVRERREHCSCWYCLSFGCCGHACVKSGQICGGFCVGEALTACWGSYTSQEGPGTRAGPTQVDTDQI